MKMKNPPHPGTGLKDEFDYLGLSTTQAAVALGVSRMQLHRIITAQSAISPDMALRLEAVIGSTADHWLRRQVSYDLAQMRNNKNHPAHSMKRIPVPVVPKPKQTHLA